MRLNRFFSFLLLSLIHYSCVEPRNDTENKAFALIDMAIEAHGGMSSYLNLHKLHYQKTSITINKENQAVDSLVQHLKHPTVHETEVQFIASDRRLKARYNGTELSAEIDGLTQYDKAVLSSLRNTIDAANFVFFQPFKLRDTSAQLRYLGNRTLALTEKNLAVEALLVNYPNSKDQWYFFFDSKTKQVVANAVLHEGKMNLIVNDSLQWHKNMLVHHYRTSYLSNTNFELIRPQARYLYTMLVFE
jgi:hypothetical protein